MTVTAKVIVEVELTITQPWDKACSAEQIFMQAKDSAIAKIRSYLKEASTVNVATGKIVVSIVGD